jgi:hypothetical protein
MNLSEILNEQTCNNDAFAVTRRRQAAPSEGRDFFKWWRHDRFFTLQ